MGAAVGRPSPRADQQVLHRRVLRRHGHQRHDDERPEPVRGDRWVVDGAVNGTGWTTVVLSWIAHVLDKYVVDGIVNLVGNTCREVSYSLRRVQTGLIQNYAFATLFGVFAFVTWYLAGR